MGDSISRAALLAEYDRLHVGKPGRARKMIEDAPTAQPEKRTHERTETHACDCISRQAAIDALEKIFPVDQLKKRIHARDYCWSGTCNRIYQAITICTTGTAMVSV